MLGMHEFEFLLRHLLVSTSSLESGEISLRSCPWVFDAHDTQPLPFTTDPDQITRELVPAAPSWPPANEHGDGRLYCFKLALDEDLKQVDSLTTRHSLHHTPA